MPICNIKDFDALVKANRLRILNGVLEGQKFSDIVIGMVNLSISFGVDAVGSNQPISIDTFDRSNFYSIDLRDFLKLNVDDLIDKMIEYSVDLLFGQESAPMAKIALQISYVVAAWSYDQRRKEIKFGEINRIVDSIIAHQKDNPNADNMELVDAFLEALLKLDNADGVAYLSLLRETKKLTVIRNLSASKNFREFYNRYLGLLA